jgi:flavin reductase (DIM6/NTAB) family NADH-FMN oxidoreductase RutF
MGGAVSSEDFLAAMRAAVTPVSIVTTNGVAGETGLTVSAVSSVSAEPPLVMACINRRTAAEAAIRTNGVFCLNLLAETQTGLAESFAGRSKTLASYDFSLAAWTQGVTGSRCLVGAVASFDCQLESVTEAGTHSVFIGRVVHLATSAAMPLAYQNRMFSKVIPLA